MIDPPDAGGGELQYYWQAVDGESNASTFPPGAPASFGTVEVQNCNN